ncbi:MAG: hypothetical protein ACE5LF_04940 [Alphaproteobacteria bacterium]
MQELAHLFVLAVFIAAVLTTITIWSPRRVWVKSIAIVTASLFLPLAYAAFADLLSKPKPVDLEWAHRNVTEATVLAASMREDDGIFLWLQIDGVAEPRSYVLPWNRELAEELQDAQREAEANRNGLRIKLPFESTRDDRDHKFYAPPQPIPPLKDLGDDGPLIYRHPGFET